MKEIEGYTPGEERGDSGKSLTVWKIARLEEKPWTSVVIRLAPLKRQLLLPEDNFNIKELRIPQEVYEQMDTVSQTETPAGGWLSTTAIAAKLGVEYKWVVRRILFIQSIGEYRTTVFGSRLHFPPEAVDELAQIRGQVAARPDHWYTLNALVKMTGRSEDWILRRLNSIGVEPVLMQDVQKNLKKHYPPDVMTEIIRMAAGRHMSNAIKGPDQKVLVDTADRFRCIYEQIGPSMTIVDFNKLGVSKKEIKTWIRYGLIIRGESGQYAFTVRARQVVMRIQQTEAFVEKMKEMIGGEIEELFGDLDYIASHP